MFKTMGFAKNSAAAGGKSKPAGLQKANKVRKGHLKGSRVCPAKLRAGAGAIAQRFTKWDDSDEWQEHKAHLAEIKKLCCGRREVAKRVLKSLRRGMFDDPAPKNKEEWFCEQYYALWRIPKTHWNKLLKTVNMPNVLSTRGFAAAMIIARLTRCEHGETAGGPPQANQLPDSAPVRCPEVGVLPAGFSRVSQQTAQTACAPRAVGRAKRVSQGCLQSQHAS